MQQHSCPNASMISEAQSAELACQGGVLMAQSRMHGKRREDFLFVLHN